MNIWWRFLILIFPIMIVVLVVTQFAISNELASSGSELNSYEKRINQLSNENKILYQQMAISKSLSVIENKAVTLGFAKTTKYLQIQKDQPVALRQ
jgi:hypothetical protein